MIHTDIEAAAQATAKAGDRPWTAEEQKALEVGLKQFGKDDADRFAKVSLFLSCSFFLCFFLCFFLSFFISFSFPTCSMPGLLF
jgi:hypothetical protein